MRLCRTLPAVAALLGLSLLLPAAARAADAPKENPQFPAWNKFAVGSSVTLVGEMNANGQKMQMEMTATLAKKEATQVTISQKATMTIGGQKIEPPARDEVVTAAPKAGETFKETGEETIQVAGKDVKCKIYEVESEAGPGQKVSSKVWFSDTIPGGAAKMVVKTPQGEMTINVKSFEAK